MHPDRDLASAGRLAKKGGLALVALHQMDLRRAHDRKNETRQAGAAAKIDQSMSVAGPVVPELAAVKNVPAPRVRQGCRADQVDSGLPMAQQIEISLAPIECFT